MAQEALPQVLSNRTYASLIKEELKRHHRWMAVVTHFSDKFPQSVTYNLTNGDDGTCERLTDETTCLAPRSAYATGQSKCYWTPAEDGIGGKCAFIQPGNDMVVVLFVAVFSAIVTTPIAILAEFIILKFLAAPTSSHGRTKINAINNSLKVSSIVPSGANSNSATNTAVVVKRRAAGQNSSYDQAIGELNRVRAEFDLLVKGLKSHMEQLTDIEREEFKRLWGLDDNGDFISSKASFWTKMKLKKEEDTEQQSVSSIVLADLLNVQKSYAEELASFFNKKAYKSDKEKNKRLLYLFQRDLLPGICGQILESKENRDNIAVKGVSKTAKFLAWSFLAILDLSMLFYIFLFAVSQDQYRQAAWAKSFALWLVAEILLVSTFIVVFTHVVVPSFIMKDVKQIKSKLVDSLVKYHNDLANNKHTKKLSELSSTANKGFNSAQFLFVSYKLACQLSNLKTAHIIAHYETVWPRQSYQHISDVSKNYNRRFTALTQSASIILMFFITNLLSVPITIQDMIVQMATTAMTGYTILIHLQLFQIYPVLIIIPSLFLGVVLHFMLQSHRKSQQEGIQALLKSQVKKEGGKDIEEEKKAGEITDKVGDKDKYGNRSKDYELSDEDDDDDDSYSSESELEDSDESGTGSLHRGLSDSSSSSDHEQKSASDDSSLSDGEIYVHKLSDHYGRTSPKSSSPKPDNIAFPYSRHRDRRQSLQLGLDIILQAQRGLVRHANTIAEQESCSEEGEGRSDESDEEKATTLSAISLKEYEQIQNNNAYSDRVFENSHAYDVALDQVLVENAEDHFYSDYGNDENGKPYYYSNQNEYGHNTEQYPDQYGTELLHDAAGYDVGSFYGSHNTQSENSAYYVHDEHDPRSRSEEESYDSRYDQQYAYQNEQRSEEYDHYTEQDPDHYANSEEENQIYYYNNNNHPIGYDTHNMYSDYDDEQQED